ncbi:MAG: SDR family oxidoreductase [Alphaproteobacteria bacterium]|nr:SDR family oxidoreductase [Alphaproteobacteria bacterium]
MTAARYPSLEDRVVLVTGGGSGIGAALVEAFHRQGARTAFLDIDEPASARLVEQLGASGAAPLFLRCDLTDIDALRAAIAAVAAALGPIRVLVNNAARDDRHAIEAVTPELWDRIMAVNLRHQFFAAQAVARGMEEAGGGSIVNLGSISWMIGQGGMPGYLTAKAAITGLTRALARDLGAKNIRVNSVLPGWTMTERQVTLWLTPEAEADLLERQCLKQKLMPAHIASMVLFLAAEDSAMCTNQSYVVDGGWV